MGQFASGATSTICGKHLFGGRLESAEIYFAPGGTNPVDGPVYISSEINVFVKDKQENENRFAQNKKGSKVYAKEIATTIGGGC